MKMTMKRLALLLALIVGLNAALIALAEDGDEQLTDEQVQEISDTVEYLAEEADETGEEATETEDDAQVEPEAEEMLPGASDEAEEPELTEEQPAPALEVEEPQPDEPVPQEPAQPEVVEPEVTEETSPEEPAEEQPAPAPEVEEPQPDEPAPQEPSEESAEPEVVEPEVTEDSVTEGPTEEQPAPEVEEPQPDEPVPQEPSEEPAEPEVVEPQPENTEAAPFAAKVHIELKNVGQLYYGDSVTLMAVVEDANAAYSVVRWEYYNVEADVEHGENPWVAVHTGEGYTFIVNEQNAFLTYRVVVEETVTSGAYKLPEVMAHQEASEPVDIPGCTEDDESDEAAVEVSDEDEQADEPDAEEEILETESVAALDPDRSISIYADLGGGQLYFGDEVTLVAEMIGYDNAVYTLQWQTSVDGVEWADVDGAVNATHVTTVTEDNYLNYWRVVVTITAVENL